MDFLPIFIRIKDRHCLVVGGGDVAARKIDMLRKCGALVTVVSPKIDDKLRFSMRLGGITHLAESFGPQHLQDMELVIAATDDNQVNREVASAARQARLPVNVVDSPALCSFIVPSIVDRTPVVVAVSTGGASPVLARQLRAQLETMIPAAYGRLAALAEEFRERVKVRFMHAQKRRAFWETTLRGPFAEMVFAGQDGAARKYLNEALRTEPNSAPQGEVYLVGAGPGNPDLLTLRALRLMQQADVVLHDNLVTPAILDLVRRDAERIYVGKQRANHALAQEEINDLLVRLAQEGKRVLRLKGGDPFIFGRGGEEIEALSSFGIPFQVVPGITAASGVAAYAGIPLTHRDYSQSCVFVTGHLKDGSMDLDWKALAQPRQTVVVYMGLKGLPVVCRELVTHGLPASTPIAIVQQGTTEHQLVLTGTLQNLPALAAAAKLKPPTLIIVGEVVKLHEKLAWYEPSARLNVADEPAAAFAPN